MDGRTDRQNIFRKEQCYIYLEIKDEKVAEINILFEKRVDSQKIIAEAECLCVSLNLLYYTKDILTGVLMCKIIEITESQL